MDSAPSNVRISGGSLAISSILESTPATSHDDLVARGQYTYRQRLMSMLEPSHLAEFVAVEPDSGQYFLGDTPALHLSQPTPRCRTTCSISPALVERPRIVSRTSSTANVLNAATSRR